MFVHMSSGPYPFQPPELSPPPNHIASEKASTGNIIHCSNKWKVCNFVARMFQRAEEACCAACQVIIINRWSLCNRPPNHPARSRFRAEWTDTHHQPWGTARSREGHGRRKAGGLRPKWPGVQCWWCRFKKRMISRRVHIGNKYSYERKWNLMGKGKW